MTRNRATAVMPMMSAAMISVTQAAPGIAHAPFRLSEKLGDGSRVPHGADRDGLDCVVGRCQRRGDALKLTDEGAAARQDVIARCPYPLKRREYPVEQRDHDGQD